MSATFWNMRRRARALKQKEAETVTISKKETVTEGNSTTETPKKPTKKGGAKKND